MDGIFLTPSKTRGPLVDLESAPTSSSSTAAGDGEGALDSSAAFVTPLHQRNTTSVSQEENDEFIARNQQRYYGKYFQRYELLIEYKSLANPGHCPTGVYVIPHRDDFYTWQGVLFLHHGYYQGATLRFTIRIPEEYPLEGPLVFFQKTDLFHPLVESGTGKFILRQQFPSWRPRQDHLCHVLFYVKKVFSEEVMLNLDRGVCANLEALDEFLNNREGFSQRIAAWVKSLDKDTIRVMDDPNLTLKFPHIGLEIEEATMKKIFKMNPFIPNRNSHGGYDSREDGVHSSDNDNADGSGLMDVVYGGVSSIRTWWSSS